MLKSWLRILFLSQGTNAVWGFNFFWEGVLKTYQVTRKMLSAGGEKASSFAIFGLCAGFRANCKCACLCAVAW